MKHEGRIRPHESDNNLLHACPSSSFRRDVTPTQFKAAFVHGKKNCRKPASPKSTTMYHRAYILLRVTKLVETCT